jgi:hypothetical protein
MKITEAQKEQQTPLPPVGTDSGKIEKEDKIDGKLQIKKEGAVD